MDNLTVITLKGQRVLTSKLLASLYETDSKTISYNFNHNKNKYTEGKHFICLQGAELKAFKTSREFHESSKLNKLYLWTEKGALLHAKSLNTDKAWEVYDHLVDFYFRAKETAPAPEALLPAAVPEATPATAPTLPATEAPAAKSQIPAMSNPILIFHVLLNMAGELGMSVNTFDFHTLHSVLHGKHIGIRANVTVEKAAYELAYELAHAMVHHDGGDLINSPFVKDYNQQAERIANLVIRALNTQIAFK